MMKRDTGGSPTRIGGMKSSGISGGGSSRQLWLFQELMLFDLCARKAEDRHCPGHDMVL